MSVPDSPLDWIELITGYACNCGCEVCPSAQLADSSILSLEEMVTALERGRRQGARGAWFGGGEPTLHADLGKAVAAARGLGYERVRVQSNGLRLAYPDYADMLAAAGMSEVALMVAGADAETHNAVSRHPQAFALMNTAIEHLIDRQIPVDADILVTARNLDQLEAIVDRCADAEIGVITFWLVSLHGLDAGKLAAWMPTMTALVGPLSAAFARASARAVVATTLHVPPCMLPPDQRGRYRHAGHWNLLVVGPGGHSFRAEESPIEGGVYVDECGRCRSRGDCLGLRADYLARYGADEFKAIGG